MRPARFLLFAAALGIVTGFVFHHTQETPAAVAGLCEGACRDGNVDAYQPASPAVLTVALPADLPLVADDVCAPGGSARCANDVRTNDTGDAKTVYHLAAPVSSWRHATTATYREEAEASDDGHEPTGAPPGLLTF